MKAVPEGTAFIFYKSIVEIRMLHKNKLFLSLSLTNEIKIENMFDLNYDVIKQEIEAEVCKEHNLHPEFVKTDDGFGIKACCEPFHKELVAKSEKMVEEETTQFLEK